MRPRILFPLFASIQTLPGVGPRIGQLIEKVAGPHVVDLLWHLPSGLIDRRYSPPIPDAPEGAIVTLTVSIEKHTPSRNRRQPYRIRCANESGFLDLVFFHAKADYLEKTYPVGQQRVISGRIEHYGGGIQMTHPDRVGKPSEFDAVATVEPVYPLTAGLTPRPLGRAIETAVKMAPDLPEWQDGPWLEQHGWAAWQAALRTAHAPAAAADIAADASARQRLAYDELLANQLAIAIVRARQRKMPGRETRGDGALRDRATAALPFLLTGSQQKTLDEILADMAARHRMLRLMQGDVGSGKTVVAYLAALSAVECGRQAAVMAPTEILARQHHETIAKMAAEIGVEVVLLTGREKGKNREARLASMADGSAAITVGTHALFQDDVAFHDLALAVVDEQHRFGVHQRLSLASKGTGVDMLVMTATPIPRTLMLAAYGDLEVSQITEKPAGRKPIDTRVLPLTRLEDVIGRLQIAISSGARVYWVCPLVEESEAVDLAAATDRYDDLARRFEGRVGLVHGRMKGTEKDTVMARFAGGEIDILVATTVIEVGVDVPEATVMVIEHADRFGLAQLHQLRGRVGRSERQSVCLLIYGPNPSETARARLQVMRDTEDGFRIAEEDLRLRGAGELLGTRQSGLPAFRIADIGLHSDLMAAARDDAQLILDRDPELTSPRGEALRMLLYLFERDAVVPTARSG